MQMSGSCPLPVKFPVRQDGIKIHLSSNFILQSIIASATNLILKSVRIWLRPCPNHLSSKGGSLNNRKGVKLVTVTMWHCSVERDLSLERGSDTQKIPPPPPSF